MLVVTVVDNGDGCVNISGYSVVVVACGDVVVGVFV